MLEGSIPGYYILFNTIIWLEHLYHNDNDFQLSKILKVKLHPPNIFCYWNMCKQLWIPKPYWHWFSDSLQNCREKCL